MPGERGVECQECGETITQVIRPAEAPRYRQAQRVGQEGEQLYAQDRYHEAAVKFRQALELAPDDPVLLLDLGNALGMLGWEQQNRPMLAESLACLAKAQELYPEYERVGRNIEVTQAKLAQL